MKRLYVSLLTLFLVFVLAVPVFALENIFGGYWRTRAYTQRDFTGDDSEALDLQQADTRTRLFYTAKFSDNFKFVNQFEMDAVFGGPKAGYGDIGADGVSVEIKNSYVDFSLAPVNLKLGVQNYKINRGFLFSDDFAGAVVTYNVNKDIEVPFFWIKATEGYSSNPGSTADRNNYDVDIYGIYPKVKLGSVTVRPTLMWATSKDASYYANSLSEWKDQGGADFEKFNMYYLGADVDAKVGPATVWFTGIYEFGTIESLAGGEDYDASGYLLALGAKADVNNINLHGQTFYATGDDNAADSDIDGFMAPIGRGQSYRWAEIMGVGPIFDNDASNGSSGDEPTNILAANMGVTVKPMEKLALTADLWWAQLAEDNPNGDKDLGTEIDFLANYKILDNLTLDVVAAYLFAGDATTKWNYADGVAKDGNENPMEIGTQLVSSSKSIIDQGRKPALQRAGDWTCRRLQKVTMKGAYSEEIFRKSVFHGCSMRSFGSVHGDFRCLCCKCGKRQARGAEEAAREQGKHRGCGCTAERRL